MTSALEFERLPFDRALEWLRQRTPLPTQAWDDLVNESQEWAFTVAGLTSAQILGEVQALTEQAIADGQLFEEFKSGFKAALARRGYSPMSDWRMRLVLLQNMRTAYGAGRYRQQMAPETLQRRPYFEWQHDDPITPRPHHQALDGKVWPASDPIWQTMYPPCGFGCRCRVFSLSRPQMERRGLSLSDSLPTVPVRDKRSGVVKQVPAVDVDGERVPVVEPGFAYAPGATLLEQRAEIFREALKRLSVPLREVVLQRLRDRGIQLAEPIDLARLKIAGNTRKGKNCKKGQVCGFSCISKFNKDGSVRKCRKIPTSEASKAISYIKKNKKAKNKTKDHSVTASAGSIPTEYQYYVDRARSFYGEEIAEIDRAVATYRSEFAASKAKVIDLMGQINARLAEGKSVERLRKQLDDEIAAQQQRTDSVRPAFKRLRDRLLDDADPRLAQSAAEDVDLDDSLERPASFYRGELRQLHAITNNQVTTLNSLILDKDRAYAQDKDKNTIGLINVGRQEDDATAATTLWHEFGHHVEFSNPNLREAANDFIRKKATSQTPVSLNQLTGVNKYGFDEVALPGNFVSPYVSKIYSDRSTEVWAMGLQHFVDLVGMRRLYEADPDHFLLTLGGLR